MTQPTLELGHAEAIIGSSDDAILSKDREGIVTSWNPGAERLYGYTPDEVIGEPISILIPESRAGEELRILERILAGERVEHYETERRRKDGEIVTVSLTISPIRDPSGEITGASVIARDFSDRRRSLQRADRLQRITSALSREISVESAAATVLDESVAALDADAATIGLVDDEGETVSLVASHGYSESAMAEWNAFPVSAELPMAEAIREAKPLWSSGEGDLVRRFPALAQAEFAFASLAVVPLTVEGVTSGAIALSFRPEREFSTEERAFLLAAAQQAANTLARARLHDREQRARQRLAFIAESSEILSGSLDLDTTLQGLASIAVPRIADWCTVDLLDGKEIRNVAVAHVDPAKVEEVHRLRERYPPDPESETGVPNVIRTAEPELYPEIPAELLEQAAEDEEHLRLLRELNLKSAVIVPLVARGRTLGAITLVTAESGEIYDAEDLAFAADLARHAALAVDNAVRYREQRETALALQRALLPGRLPDLPGAEFAARYLPAGPDVEAGGDWYDVIDLGGDDLVLVIGDVSGRGIPAASIMGRLRIATRAYALDGHRPDEVVHRLHHLMEDFEEREMATMFYLHLSSTGRGEYVRAGHPPTLVRRPGGQVVNLLGQGSPPIGVIADPAYKVNSVELEPGSMIFLYTDGLVERREAGIDPGIAQLERRLASAPEDPEGCLQYVIDPLDPAGVDDDVAVLAVALRDGSA